MKPFCPACALEMSEINRYKYNNHYDLMHFNCLNSQCPAKIEINYISHVSLFVSSSKLFELVDVNEYHLPFKWNGEWYHLIGLTEVFDGTILRKHSDPKPLMLVEFVYIPPADVYGAGWKLFNRLHNMIVFL